MRCLCYNPYQNRFLGLPGYPRLISADRRSLCGRLVNSPDDNRVFSTHRARDWRFPAGCDAGCKVDHLERFSGGWAHWKGPSGGVTSIPLSPLAGRRLTQPFCPSARRGSLFGRGEIAISLCLDIFGLVSLSILTPCQECQPNTVPRSQIGAVDRCPQAAPKPRARITDLQILAQAGALFQMSSPMRFAPPEALTNAESLRKRVSSRTALTTHHVAVRL